MLARLAALALALALVLALAGCFVGPMVSPDSDLDNDGVADDRESAYCTLPWDSIYQVEVCGTAGAREVANSGIRFDVVIREKDADTIARALAGAWLAREDTADEIVVWAWSRPGAKRGGGGYDRGVVSEQGELGEELVFQICTAWEPIAGPGDLCADEMEFTIEQ